ncbi:hypothetical protein [Flagellimonas sp. CMM7]|uniref:hypothetical protein n=1 Tax=Flagellimonas sp. CMM7 TaxID=2654676 RepID=UPI0013D392D4|nr:hypothetical protein [Flagellimonas sp. CMM7]UII80283.1 hypothetical protein LV704_01935 [Flagellimonas sp. CMM7]
MKSRIGIVFALIMSWYSNNCSAQIIEPATWSHEVSDADVKKGQVVELCFKVELDPSWYVYATDQDPNLGPLPTTVTFTGKGFELLGGPEPIKVITKYDGVWKGEVRIITESGGGFKQHIRILEDNPEIRAVINYTVCSMETGQCVMGEEELDIDLKALR